MSEWTDDSRDEPADDQHDDTEEADEAADGPSDADPVESSGADEVPDDLSGSEQEDDEPNATAPGDDPVDEGEHERDRDSHDDRRAAPRDPHPHTRAANAGSDDGDDHWLSSLIDALERLEGSSTSGQRRSNRTVLDYDISIGTAVDSDDDELPESPFGSNSIDDSSGEHSRRNRSRKRRRRPGSSGGHHLTTRTAEDELLVTADVAGADPDDITVGFDDGTLVVAVSGRELDRVDVPWAERTADATIKNGILTVEVTPGSRSTGEEDDDE